MEYQLHIQDPDQSSTRYLFESMVEAAESANSWHGIFAFASKNGIENLFRDPSFGKFLSTGTASLIVGIDAVTNRAALETLQQFEAEFAGLTARVFWNKTSKLFHPKLSLFESAAGSRELIVGSGNLTPGGLRLNHEAYSVVRSDVRKDIDITSLESFFEHNKDAIRPIDEEVLSRAAKNVFRGRRTGRGTAAEQATPEPDVDTPDGTEPIAVPTTARLLIARVPAAAGRWAQIHLNRDVVEQFFRIKPNSAERAFLNERRMDGTFGPEEVRPCIYAVANKNFKIEMAAAKGHEYPSAGPPLALYLELGLRTFEYMLLFPSHPLYGAVDQLLVSLPPLGRGLHRSVTTLEALGAIWPDCPFLQEN